MSLHHAGSGELINIQPLGAKLADSPTVALLKSSQLEVMRMILAAGKSVPEHHVGGEMTVQCLEGSVELRAHDKTQVLHGGEMVFLESNVRYALHALENTSLLITMVLIPDEGSSLSTKQS